MLENSNFGGKSFNSMEEGFDFLGNRFLSVGA